MTPTTKINFAKNWRQELETLVEGALRQRIFPGMELLVARGQDKLLHQTWGRMEIGPEAPSLAPGTLFDIASITKPMATATALLILMEKGVVGLEEKVADLLPEFDTPEKRGVTLRHLLTHTSGLPALADLYQENITRAEALQKLLAMPLKTPTGAAMIYGDPNFLLLGEIIRRLSNLSLEEFFHQHIAHPLQLTRTAFNPLALQWDMPIAPTQYCPIRKQLLRGVVHDESSWIMGGEGGNAGLFSTAEDLWRFARMVQNGGELDGVRILSPRTVQLMLTNHNPPKLAPRGLGWDMKGEGLGYMSCGELMAVGCVGHTGFTGTSLWMEPVSGFTIIMLSNRVHISRDRNQQDMIRFRPRLHNLLVAALG